MMRTTKGAQHQDVDARQFTNVTVYTTGNVLYPCVVRIDAREAAIRVAPYAQHTQSIYVDYLPKGRRVRRRLIVPHSYVIVVPTKHAIDPDDLFLPALDGAFHPRYDITDPRWRTDFDEKLSREKVPILLDYRGLF